jgi:hypothetical protein
VLRMVRRLSRPDRLPKIRFRRSLCVLQQRRMWATVLMESREERQDNARGTRDVLTSQTVTETEDIRAEHASTEETSGHVEGNSPPLDKNRCASACRGEAAIANNCKARSRIFYRWKCDRWSVAALNQWIPHPEEGTGRPEHGYQQDDCCTPHSPDQGSRDIL